MTYLHPKLFSYPICSILAPIHLHNTCTNKWDATILQSFRLLGAFGLLQTSVLCLQVLRYVPFDHCFRDWTVMNRVASCLPGPHIVSIWYGPIHFMCRFNISTHSTRPSRSKISEPIVVILSGRIQLMDNIIIHGHTSY